MHNPAGMRALVESLPELTAGAPTVAAVSILDDKDAAGMLSELLPACAAAVFTSSSNPRALPPPTLQSLARQLGFERQAEPAPEPNPERALERARTLAGAHGVVLATGSIYLVADLARSPGALRASHR